MATQKDCRATRTVAAAGPSPARLAAGLWSRFLAAIERRRQLRALGKLENRLLDDIGLTREEVERELSRLPWK